MRRATAAQSGGAARALPIWAAHTNGGGGRLPGDIPGQLSRCGLPAGSHLTPRAQIYPDKRGHLAIVKGLIAWESLGDQITHGFSARRADGAAWHAYVSGASLPRPPVDRIIGPWRELCSGRTRSNISVGRSSNRAVQPEDGQAPEAKLTRLSQARGSAASFGGKQEGRGEACSAPVC